MIFIIDYGIGNLGSVKNMFRKIGVETQFATKPEDLDKASKIILPGVGAFDSCVEALNNSGMVESLKKQVIQEKKQLLGICVGFQMLTHRSEEGRLAGLGWLDAETLKFVDHENKWKIPHMGWNYINPTNAHFLTESYSQTTDLKSRAYFVHSFYVKARNQEDVILQSHYIHNFASGMAKDNIMGVQFHPEKSHKFGMQLFKSFAEN